MLPWKFLNLTPRDASGTLLRLWNQWASFTSAASSVAQSWVVPADSAALVYCWSAAVVSGAVADQPLNANLAIFHPPGSGNDPHFQSFKWFDQGLGNANTTGLFGFATVNLPLVIAGPNDRITITANKAAGAGTNAYTMSISASLIPRGDMAYL